MAATITDVARAAGFGGNRAGLRVPNGSAGPHADADTFEALRVRARAPGLQAR